jgi:hypothetical protein
LFAIESGMYLFGASRCDVVDSVVDERGVVFGSCLRCKGLEG